VNYHYRELIDKYQPSILWNDIGYPPGTNVNELFAYFYNRTPEGVVNDRWIQVPKHGRKLITSWPVANFVEWYAQRLVAKGGLAMPAPPHSDYATPEYSTLATISKRKWECVRGIGHSFGYNQMESEDQYMKAPEAVRMLVDIVSKNGNLLLNVGPRADGSIPEGQLACIQGIGKWLKTNGEAIYGTRPWTRAEGKTSCGVDVRFTAKGNTLYAILLDTPLNPEIEIIDLKPAAGSQIELLGHEPALAWRQSGENLWVTLPDHLPDSPAHVLVMKM